MGSGDEARIYSRLSQKNNQAQSKKVTDSQLSDRATVSECPGLWAWASPFIVEAISGEMAKLEMVGELVELKRLSPTKI